MLIREWIEQNRNVFLACSALTQAIREELKGGDPDVRFVYLKGDAEHIRERLRKREGHFMPASLVASQFETLEEPAPAEALIVDALGPI
jgi:gluconokinase